MDRILTPTLSQFNNSTWNLQKTFGFANIANIRHTSFFKKHHTSFFLKNSDFLPSKRFQHRFCHIPLTWFLQYCQFNCPPHIRFFLDYILGVLIIYKLTRCSEYFSIACLSLAQFFSKPCLTNQWSALEMLKRIVFYSNQMYHCSLEYCQTYIIFISSRSVWIHSIEFLCFEGFTKA